MSTLSPTALPVQITVNGIRHCNGESWFGPEVVVQLQIGSRGPVRHTQPHVGWNWKENFAFKISREQTVLNVAVANAADIGSGVTIGRGSVDLRGVLEDITGSPIVRAVELASTDGRPRGVVMISAQAEHGDNIFSSLLKSPDSAIPASPPSPRSPGSPQRQQCPVCRSGHTATQMVHNILAQLDTKQREVDRFKEVAARANESSAAAEETIRVLERQTEAMALENQALTQHNAELEQALVELQQRCETTFQQMEHMRATFSLTESKALQEAKSTIATETLASRDLEQRITHLKRVEASNKKAISDMQVELAKTRSDLAESHKQCKLLQQEVKWWQAMNGSGDAPTGDVSARFPLLGLTLAEAPGASGVRIVEATGPAQFVGVRPGDLAQHFYLQHTTAVHSLFDFRRAMDKVRPHDLVTLTILRGGEHISFTIEPAPVTVNPYHRVKVKSPVRAAF
eukprot:TRINITY_DN15779_c0_g1_i1.p1 TRINITY_DN15779_c0_g1~~TRINITY_DN15779_c0_g1_i1.p1  ORF type:complete len:457 (+),score=81.65 TRINITY_DN15779_c0_g1_i1:710-2080(+)